MGNINQKECIKVNFTECLNNFDDHCGYLVTDDHEKYNGPTVKFMEIYVAYAGKLLKRCKLRRIGLFDNVTRAALKWAVARDTIRLHSPKNKEASNPCPT